MTVYNKLVRDRIPEIIRANGGEPVTRILNDDEFREALRMKLREEVEEYLASSSIEELADILEVLRALASADTTKWEKIEHIREEKARARGSFRERVFLLSV